MQIELNRSSAKLSSMKMLTLSLYVSLKRRFWNYENYLRRKALKSMKVRFCQVDFIQRSSVITVRTVSSVIYNLLILYYRGILEIEIRWKWTGFSIYCQSGYYLFTYKNKICNVVTFLSEKSSSSFTIFWEQQMYFLV